MAVYSKCAVYFFLIFSEHSDSQRAEFAQIHGYFPRFQMLLATSLMP